jgi:hypothetical protein
MGRKKDKKTIFREISDNFLSDLLVNEYDYLIDDYLTLPNIVVYIVEDNNLENKNLGSKTSKFNDFLEVIDFINKVRRDNYFFIHRINVIDKEIILRWAEVILENRVLGLEHIRLQRLRDKKINEILE